MKKKIALMTLLLIILVTNTVLSHSGKTDSSGGHYNSSTGEYHYHHGYSAHQHPGGVCPYQTTTSASTEELLVQNNDSELIEDLRYENERLQNKIYNYEESLDELNVTSISQLANTIDTLSNEKQELSDSLYNTQCFGGIVMIFLIMLSIGLYRQNN